MFNNPAALKWWGIVPRGIIRDSISTTAIGVIARIPGFFVPFLIAAWFGISGQTDVFFFSYGIILFLAGIFISSLETITVPFIIEKKTAGEDVGSFIGNILVVSNVLIVTVFLIFLLFARPLLNLITNFDDEGISRVIRILLVTLPFAMFLVSASILKASLNAYKKFAWAAFPGLFQSLGLLTIIFLTKQWLGIYSIVLGYVVGSFLCFCVLLGMLKKAAFFKLRLSFTKSPAFFSFAKIVSFQFGIAILLRFNSIIDRTMASWVDPGSVSILHYAERLHIIPFTLLSLGLLPVLLSHWGNSHYGENDSDSRSLFDKITPAISVLSIAGFMIVVILFIMNRPLIELLYNSTGRFEASALNQIRLTWLAYLFGLVPQILSLILSQGYLILKKTAFLFKSAVFISLVNVGLNLVFMRTAGVKGIAFATTITHLILFVLFYVNFPKYNTSIPVKAATNE